MVAALVVANPFGDVLDEDGSVLAGAKAARTGDMLAALEEDPLEAEERNTSLVCLMTDAALDKAACARVARAASAGVARAVEPVFTDVDGDVVFCLASGEREPGGRFEVLQLQALAARVTAAAIRDAAAPSPASE